MEQLLTAEDVARLLNIKVSTVYDGVYRGLLPAVRLWQGKRRALLRFRQSDLEQFVREHATTTPTIPSTGSLLRRPNK
jgi:excisionase family DNA binding protein